LALVLASSSADRRTAPEHVAPPSEGVVSASSIGSCRSVPVAGAPAARRYRLWWDDSLDGDLERPCKQCIVELQRVDRTLTGRFVGTVLGEARTATFTGESVGSTSPPGRGDLWILQQREPGYVCSYQLSPSRHGAWNGTWRDSRGRTGTARLSPVPEGPILVCARPHEEL
ncbi:MAG: hypothetical protein AAGA20_13950, partial [Planctomycetota bacterium]